MIERFLYLPLCSSCPQFFGPVKSSDSRWLVSMSQCLLACFCAQTFVAWSAAPNLPASRDLPDCPPEWKIEVVAAPPKIRHPSVVCSAPDGRVFVAEDPMDISAPSADLALGRIVCFHPDGRTTLFADKLYAVFGMQYLEGQLYVLHNPKLSVFTDDNGIGRNRVDLIASTNPNPWALNWNDHVPANFRLAMDGFFYVAVGDKGVYGAIGKDGKRVNLYGGGILRLRPDGAELEVYATGVRNILDVALNTEDEIFTYDNTDEQQWMSRLTHMVDGGFYGYPYDFIPRRPYTLWMMADYGGGAATGTLAYNDDALPPEYHGNLFLADFGKRQVLRVKIAREGGGFKAVSHQDFFSNVPTDFRPVGIGWAADGLGFYVCDWAHRDIKAQVEVGRLLKVTYTGKSHAAVKPDWYVPAAMGRAFEATTSDLAKALSHPAHSVRMVAQRKLVERARQAKNNSDAANVTALLTQVLGDRQNSSLARWHAIWALDAIDSGVATRGVIWLSADDADVSLCRQAIRQLGLRRAAQAVPLLERKLRDKDASIRFQAATALGRIGQAASVNPLLGALAEEDLYVRYAVFTALNRIGRANPPAWNAIVRGLENSDQRIVEAAAFALRETYDTTLVDALAALARDAAKPSGSREAAMKLAAALHHERPPWKGEWWAYHPVNAPPPAKTVEWAGTPKILATLREGLNDPNSRIRLASIEGLREARDINAAPKLRALFLEETNAENRRRILSALGSMKDASASGLIVSVLKSPEQHRDLLEACLESAEQIGGDEISEALSGFLGLGSAEKGVLLKAIQAVTKLKLAQASALLVPLARRADAEVREAALDALAKINRADALSQILPLLDDSNPSIRRSVINALSALKSKASVPSLLRAYQDAATRTEAIVALAGVPDARASDAYLIGLMEKNAEVREKSRKAISMLRNELLPEIETKLSQLPPEVIAQLQEVYRNHVEAKKGRLFATAAKKLEPTDYLAFALSNKGNAERGQKLFADLAGAACVKCHAVAGQGGQVGPDLSTIGAQGARETLVDSILFPSKAAREGYQQIIIETKDDEQVAGLLKTETAEALVLQDADGKLHPIPKAALKNRRSSELSLMPERLHEIFSLEEFADLVAYLENLRGDRGVPTKP